MASENERQPLLRSVNSNVSNDYDYVGDSRQEIRMPTSRGGVLSGVLILILVLLERIGYYSLTGNLYLFLCQSQFHWMYYNAISALLIFTGISYLSCLFGGWLSDAYLGRYKTIGFAFFLFTGAYWFMPYMTKICPNEPMPLVNLTNGSDSNILDFPLYDENCSWALMGVLIFAAIGTGTVKANITPFGAEQVRYIGADGLRLYLNWLYWCVNIGALVAILGITYVQQEYKFTIGYAIPAGLLTAASLIFWFTFPLYNCQPPSGSSISRILGVLKEAWKSNNVASRENASLGSVNRPTWLDMAKVRYGGIFHESVVEDVKSLSTILKVFIILIPYWMLYFQMQSTFLAQGLQMRLNPSPSNTTNPSKEETFTIPAAWLMLFNVVFLIIFIPLMNHIIYPCLSRRGVHISMLTRMAIGMASATLSMVIAGLLELCRLTFIQNGKIVNQNIENTAFVAADLSILWQIPQYSLIGISEVFTSVSGMEFACSQAPSNMQGAVMGLYYFCTGIGSFLGVAALKIYEQIAKVYIHHSTSDTLHQTSDLNRPASDINEGSLYYYFFFLALLQLSATLVFCCVAKNLKIRKRPYSNGSVTNLLGSSSRSIRTS